MTLNYFFEPFLKAVECKQRSLIECIKWVCNFKRVIMLPYRLNGFFSPNKNPVKDLSGECVGIPYLAKYIHYLF